MTSELQEVQARGGGASRRAFVVVGMHRSGTSAMTRMLSLLGAGLPKHVIRPAKDNEAGFWESRNVALLNDEILQTLDSEWDDVFAYRPRAYLSNFDRFYLGRAVELVEQEFNGAEVIVLKDPRISVLSSFWDRVLREAGYDTHYVVMVRNPLEVAESLRARNGFPREKSLLLWSTYMIAVDRDTRTRGRTFVAYDQLMNDWRSVQRRIEESAGVPFPRDTAGAAIEIDRFLDIGLRHHESPLTDLLSRADVPEDVKTLYRIFSDACEGGTVDTTQLEAIQAELEKIDMLVGPLFVDLRGSARRLSKEVEELTQANALVRDRADALEEQLSAERTRRQAEAEAISKSTADYERQLADLARQIFDAEAERDRLVIDAEQKARDATEIASRLASAEAERDRLAAQAEAEKGETTKIVSRLAAAEAERDRIIGEGEAKAREIVALSERLQSAEDLLSMTRTETDRVREDSEREVERVKSAAAADLRASQEACKRAEAAARTNEGKLAQRYQEMATLTKLLRQEEQRGEQAEEQVSWLLRLNQRLAERPRWWDWMPKPWARRRTLRRIRDAGLFDADAYLLRYPDVAAARRDPLEHYLEHGINEGRFRSA